jgi:hypothetical protein
VALQENDCPTTTADLVDWCDDRKDFIRDALTGDEPTYGYGVNVRPQFVVTTSDRAQVATGGTVTIEGNAPIEVVFLYMTNPSRGTSIQLAPDWTTVTHWRAIISAEEFDIGENSVVFEGRDRRRRLLDENDTGNFIDNFVVIRQ